MHMYTAYVSVSAYIHVWTCVHFFTCDVKSNSILFRYRMTLYMWMRPQTEEAGAVIASDDSF